MSKITLTLFILFSLRVTAYDQGVDPNEAMGRGPESGLSGCLTGECNPNRTGFEPLTESKNNAEAINTEAGKAKALKDAINRKDDRYKLRPEDVASTPEEIEQKRRDVIKSDVNRKDVDESTEKVKKGLELREGIAGGETSIGGVKVKVKASPTRGGAKIKVKGEF